METVVKKLYEAMFLVDSEQAADWERINRTIKNILKRSEAEIVSIRKWDERKLAYQINGQNRGTYILCYFRADGQSIRNIERDVRLSERIMRVLILSAEAIGQEDIERNLTSQKAGETEAQEDTSATQAEKQDRKSARQRTQTKHVDTQHAAKLADQQEQQEESED